MAKHMIFNISNNIFEQNDKFTANVGKPGWKNLYNFEFFLVCSFSAISGSIYFYVYFPN